MNKSAVALMTGAGIGVFYSKLRERGAFVTKTGGTSSGPIPLMEIVNEVGRGVRRGGDGRGAIWAGLHWNHPDCHAFIRVKDWSPEVRALKEKDVSFPAALDMTNISAILDDEFFSAYHDTTHTKHDLAKSIYWDSVAHMLRTGEPGFSVDVGANSKENLRNACTEICSEDDSDICNIGTINMARVRSPEHMRQLVRIGIAFLLAGTEYSDVPFQKIADVRKKNRRLGLGLMGLHEWLLTHGKKYGPDAELDEYLKIYATSTEIAHEYADAWGLSRPVKTRSLQPNGTTGIVAETTTSGEPVYCVAMKRRYWKGDRLAYQYVIDPTAKRLIDSGIKPEAIEDAYSLAADVERRVAFQAHLQSFVDHGIASTINLPAWGSELNNESRVKSFGEMLLKYLPKLRGITVYPDGARGGQPLTPVKYATAVKHVGEVFFESVDSCDITRAGSCG